MITSEQIIEIKSKEIKCVRFAPFCSLSEIKSHKNMTKEEKHNIWYNNQNLRMFKKSIEYVIQAQKRMENEQKFREISYFVSMERQKRRWLVMDFILRTQSATSDIDLARLYNKITTREREIALKRAFDDQVKANIYQNIAPIPSCIPDILIENGKRRLYDDNTRISQKRRNANLLLN